MKIALRKRFKDTRTYADRRKYNIQAVSKRRRAIKALAIEYKGGKCQICGYNRYQGALELHHINPKQKEFSISKKGPFSLMERVKKEIDKCTLVCANCHREVEAGIISV